MRREANYLYLMLGLALGIVLITASRPQALAGVLGVSTGVFSLMIVSAFVLAARKRQILIVVLLAASAYVPFVWMNINPRALSPDLANSIYTINLCFWLLFIVYIGTIVFRSIMTATRIRGNEIYGVIYLYLLIGVMFAILFQILVAWQPGALYFDPARFPPSSVVEDRLYTRGAGDIIYYSFVTLGTVGYGDVTPATPLARAISLIEAVAGIMYVATMIARFVSIHTSAARAHTHADSVPASLEDRESMTAAAKRNAD
jgi:hypothetical protein